MSKVQFRPYTSDQLPLGFTYPAALLALVNQPDVPDLNPWQFIDATSKVGQLAYAVRQSDGRNLIPFASVEDDRKDIACFDGDDTTGSPAVLMLVVDGSGRSYAYADFAAWLETARLEAARWRG